MKKNDETKRYKMRYIPFVLGNIISQGKFVPSIFAGTNIKYLIYIGQSCPSSRLRVRFAAGAWCCACFFLVQIYCCTLTSYLSRPNQKTIVNSVFDIPQTPGVGFTVNRGQGVDLILQVSI